MARLIFKSQDIQLLIQFEAVDRETPLLRIDNEKTSFGRTHPIGPKLMPYAAVKV